MSEIWPEPSPAAMGLIERVFRLANALRVLEIDPGATGVALIISQNEAFTLLDQLKQPWRMAVWGPARKGTPEVELVDFDLSVLPRPGLKWGLLFGVTLIIDEAEADDTPLGK